MTGVQRGAVLVLLAVLVVSLGAGALLAHATLDYVEASEALRLDPAGLKVYAGSPPEAANGGPLLEFFGDSRALMWSRPTASTGYRIVNRGIGRQTTAQLLLRFDADVTALRPAVVVIEGGINDLKTIANFPDRRLEIIADCEANLATIVDRCRRAGAEVVLVTVFDIGDVPLWRRPFWSHDVEAAVREVNAFLPRLTGDKVVLFDANPALDDGPAQIRSQYQLDYLHLTAAGYAALNERLVPLLSTFPR